jgi:hypothetical protein
MNASHLATNRMDYGLGAWSVTSSGACKVPIADSQLPGTEPKPRKAQQITASRCDRSITLTVNIHYTDGDVYAYINARMLCLLSITFELHRRGGDA